MKKLLYFGIIPALFLASVLSGCGGGNSSPGKDSPGNTPPENPKIIVVGAQWDLSSSRYKWWIKAFDESGLEDTTNWNKILDDGEIAYSVKVDSENNILVAGTCILKKFSANGTLLWTQPLDIWDFTIVNLTIDKFNNIYVIGAKNSVATNWDWRIQKFSPDGIADTVYWDKTIDGGGNSVDYGYSIVVDNENNVYAVGTKTNNAWLKKFSNSGIEDTTGWNKTITDAAACDVRVDSQGNIYVIGIKSSNWMIKKFSKDGVEDLNWNKLIDCGGIYYGDGTKSIAFDSTNNVYVAGAKALVNGQNWWIKKFSQSGLEDTAGWNKEIGLETGTYSCAYSIAIDPLGNVFVAGSKNNTADTAWWIKKFSATGIEDPNWDKTYTGGRIGACAYSIAFFR